MRISLRAVLQILQRSVERKYNPLLSPQFRDKTNETITENGKVLAFALNFFSRFDIPISFIAANIIIIVLLCPIRAFLNQSYLLVYCLEIPNDAHILLSQISIGYSLLC